MPPRNHKNRSAPLRRFLKRLAADFGDDCRLAPPEELVLIANGFLISVAVRYYSEPDRQAPDRPAIPRITIGAAFVLQPKSLGPLRRRLKHTRPFPHRLEFSLTPKELASAPDWIAQWIRKQAADDPAIDPPPVKLEEPYDALFAPNSDAWRKASYLWTRKAQERYADWESQCRAAAADEKQFPVRVFDDQYPQVETSLTPPQYSRPAWPEPWFTPATVRFANMFRPRRPLGKFLIGPRVDIELRAASERGYIVLPQGADRSTWWRAWNSTWREYCQIPGHRRPYVSVTVGRSRTARGRRLSLFWDWITLDPLTDFNIDPRDPRSQPWQTPPAQAAWNVLEDRLYNYFAALPLDEVRALTKGAKPFSLLTPTIGRIHCWRHDDEPLTWIFDWITTCLRQG